MRTKLVLRFCSEWIGMGEPVTASDKWETKSNVAITGWPVRQPDTFGCEHADSQVQTVVLSQQVSMLD